MFSKALVDTFLRTPKGTEPSPTTSLSAFLFQCCWLERLVSRTRPWREAQDQRSLEQGGLLSRQLLRRSEEKYRLGGKVESWSRSVTFGQETSCPRHFQRESAAIKGRLCPKRSAQRRGQT
jgi:hypothetical protein